MRPCPACRTADLKNVETRSLKAGACDECYGLWCEGEDLAAALEDDVVAALKAGAEAGVSRCRSCDATSATSPCEHCGGLVLACPSCSGELLASVRQRDVQLDACPSCHGVWLDAGELLAVSNRSPAAVALQNAAFGTNAVAETDAPLACADCGRSLQGRTAFSHGLAVYCASCAPKGSVERDIDVSRLRRGTWSETMQGLQRDGVGDVDGLVNVLDFLSRLFR